jgi:integrase
MDSQWTVLRPTHHRGRAYRPKQVRRIPLEGATTLAQWKAYLGHRRLDQIKRIHINSFIAARQKAGMSARTVNLEVTVFRNMMNRAIDEKWILLAFSGARMTEALRLRWSDVDWDNHQLTIGSEAEVKNRKWPRRLTY